MREIKFRGKRIDNGEWVYGDLFQPLGHYPIIINTEPDNEGKVADIHNECCTCDLCSLCDRVKEFTEVCAEFVKVGYNFKKSDKKFER